MVGMVVYVGCEDLRMLPAAGVVVVEVDDGGYARGVFGGDILRGIPSL